MDSGPPDLIAIGHDNHHACHIGYTEDGRQFFLTRPFVAASDEDPGREFIALYLFDDEGELLEYRIDDLGPRIALDEEASRRLYDRRLEELGPVEFDDIEVRPFTLERYGTTFGLVPAPPEDEEEDWWVEAQPGNYMAFYPPWTGEYDT
jgi:hypothetical protein